MNNSSTPVYRVIGSEGAVPDSPLVFDSPHSWRDWPASGVQQSIAPEQALLTSWDAFMDEMWAEAAEGHAPVLAAHFHRAYIDANRARDDIDPSMLDGVWHSPLNTSKKSLAGMGLIRRFALPGVPIYDGPLSIADVQERITTFYDPYHHALGRLIDVAAQRFGFACHIDCHSMKSVGNAMNDDGGQRRPDIVVSDRDGSTSASWLTQRIAKGLEEQGFRVQVNHPYKGAELIRRHSAPGTGRHSVQIEINRGLYMDEHKFIKSAGFDEVTRRVRDFVRALRADFHGVLGGRLRNDQTQSV